MIVKINLIFMYIRFLNDQKELKLLIQQEKILFVKTKKGHKIKYVTTILLVANWINFWTTQRLC